jgi:demethylmenaquinone methyltransferase / 2-methoxy-6-polyprenyl-1,4-benzoquinol methylase
VVQDIFSTMAPRIDSLDTLFSLGLCHLWRRSLVSAIQPGEAVLDLCTGTGEVARRLLDRTGPQGSVTGADFSRAMLGQAIKKLGSRPGRLRLLRCDARTLALADDTFDAVTVAFGLRNVPDTPAALREIHRVLKPAGRFYCLELTRPADRWFLPMYDLYTFKLMPAVARGVVGSAAPYHYLPRSIRAFHPPETFKRLLAEAGFVRVDGRSLSRGIATLYQAEKE